MSGTPEPDKDSSAPVPGMPTAWPLWIVSGFGFALGFGWLWFAPLQDFWLPEFLWGQVFSGGGTSLFVALLCAGFVLAGAAVLFFPFKPPPEEGISPARDFRAGRLSHISHVLALAFAGLALLASERGLPYAAAGCMALAGVVLGLYWMAALLALPGRQSQAAFISACGFSAVLALLHDIAPVETGWLLLIELFAAWLAAAGLIRILRHLRLEAEVARLKAPEPKRARGRPVQRAAPPTEEPRPGRLPWAVLALPAVVFTFTGFAQAVLGHVTAAGSGWYLPGNGLALAIVACGAATSLGLHTLPGRFNIAEKTAAPFAVCVCASLVILGLVLVFLPEMLPFAVHFAEGAACGAIFPLFAAALPGMFLPLSGFQRKAWLRAAFLPTCAVLCTHIGITGAVILHFFCEANPHAGRLTAAWAGGIALLAAGLLGLTIRLGLYRRASIQTGDEVDELQILLTEREYAIADLVMRGLSNKDISASLFISEDTVRFHLKRIYQKTGLADRDALRGLARDKAS